LQRDHIYVFAKRTYVPDEILAINELPKRLEDAGARVIKKPQTPGDFTHRFGFGWGFRIEFTYRGRRGAIQNSVMNIDKEPEEVLIVGIRAP
jgi:hypothetical protein